MTHDIEYINTGFTRFVPNTPAGEDAWRVMDGCVLSIHLDNVLRQLRKAGLSVGKAQHVAFDTDALLEELKA